MQSMICLLDRRRRYIIRRVPVLQKTLGRTTEWDDVLRASLEPRLGVGFGPPT